MVLDAIVKEDGTLIAKAPKSLWGKKIKISVLEKKSKKISQWEQMSTILNEVQNFDTPQRTIDEILADIHTFREST